jgi:hypothetical protein
MDLLKEGVRYYVEEVEKKKVVDLNGFYEKLKERKRTEDEVKVVMNVFAEQGILFEDLMETGDLAITDDELKEYGIKQGELRKAILSTIKNLKN